MGQIDLAALIISWVPAVGGPDGVIPADQLALIILLDATGPVSIGTLRSTLHLGQSTASELVDRAAQRGLVERQKVGRDRRRTFVALTAKAVRWLERRHGRMAEAS